MRARCIVFVRENYKSQKCLCGVGAVHFFRIGMIFASSVCFAGGENDVDSVEDFEYGRGKVRWHVSKSYFYRRGRNVDGYRYRRRMRLTVETKKLIWPHEEDSDDDGFVNQESFILPPKRAIDEHGHPTGLPIDDVQGYATEGATKLTQTFGGIRNESQILDGTLGRATSDSQGSNSTWTDFARRDPFAMAYGSFDLTARRRH